MRRTKNLYRLFHRRRSGSLRCYMKMFFNPGYYAAAVGQDEKENAAGDIKLVFLIFFFMFS